MSRHTETPQTPAPDLAAAIRTYAVAGHVITDLEAARLLRLADAVAKVTPR